MDICVRRILCLVLGCAAASHGFNRLDRTTYFPRYDIGKKPWQYNTLLYKENLWIIIMLLLISNHDNENVYLAKSVEMNRLYPAQKHIFVKIVKGAHRKNYIYLHVLGIRSGVVGHIRGYGAHNDFSSFWLMRIIII